MIPRMVEVSKFNGKSWEPSGTAVFHGFFPDYEEFAEGPGNYPAALVEWEDGKVESVVAHSIRFLVPTLTLEATKEAVRADWLSKEMQTPAKGFPALRPKWVLVGDKVRVKGGLPLPRGLYSGQVGKVASVYGGEIQVAFERSWLHFMEDDLDPADLEPVE